MVRGAPRPERRLVFTSSCKACYNGTKTTEANTEKMKIALIGDLQYQQGEQESIRKYMTQIAAWQPELAVSMGDMGTGEMRGAKEAMLECRSFFDILPCETVTLLGNHDVEYRPDAKSRAYLPEQWRKEVFGTDVPWRAVEAEGFLLLCLSIERQSEELFLSPNALYLSPEQTAWARAILAVHKDMPTIIISHSPVAGSGLRCCPPVHHRATDAFMGQNFDPCIWKTILDENPQIFMWCSAHFHMGHAYARAVTVRGTTTHVSCGVMCSCARDDTRQTRLLELKDGCVQLYTMDHLQNGLLSHDMTVCPGGKLPETEHSLLIGADKALKIWDCPALGRVYIATQGGRLWEYDHALEERTGTLCLDEYAREVCVFCSRIYVRTSKGCFSVAIDSHQRFCRLGGFTPQEKRPETDLPAKPLPSLRFSAKQEAEGEYITFPGL